MNTPAHLIFGLTAFGRAHQPQVTAAAFAGALIPDLSLYLMAGTHLLILDTAPEVVFGELYFSENWQSVFRIDNSIVLWGIAFVSGLLLRAPVIIALCGAAIMHLAFDLSVHHDDGRAHFWPISNWIFQSPISYWDPQHHGQVVGILEVVVALVCCVVLWRRFTGRWMRVFVVGLALAEAVPGILFALIFAGGAGG